MSERCKKCGHGTHLYKCGVTTNIYRTRILRRIIGWDSCRCFLLPDNQEGAVTPYPQCEYCYGCWGPANCACPCHEPVDQEGK